MKRLSLDELKSQKLDVLSNLQSIKGGMALNDCHDECGYEVIDGKKVKIDCD